MAEPLKARYGPEIARRLAAEVRQAWPEFDVQAFLADALDGYEALELMPRGRHLAAALQRHLPDDYPRALELLLASIATPQPAPAGQALAPFFYLPHTEFVARCGLGHPNLSLQALHTLTQRFTAEFAIRPFLDQDPTGLLSQLEHWSRDPSAHVRRLVSEGTRPRLPWAPRLHRFGADPLPVLALLERLRDDPEPYVRRSVANHLNDLGKDHPHLLLDTARRWWADAPAPRRQLITHALRTLLKQGQAEALALIGYGPNRQQAEIVAARFEPAQPHQGPDAGVRVELTLHNPAKEPLPLRVDLRVHFVKADGRSSPKVFRLGDATLAPGERLRLGKRISLAPLTTRRHHPGWHRVETMINGEVRELGGFELVPG